MKTPLSILSLLAASMPSFGARVVEKPAPHYGTPRRDPSRRRMPLAKRRHGPKSMPDDYYAQVTALKHMHSAAKRAACKAYDARPITSL